MKLRCRASLVAQTVKCLPAMRETQVRSLGQEDPLEKEMATHSSILAYLHSMGSQRVRHDWVTSLHFTSKAYHSAKGFFSSSDSKESGRFWVRKILWRREWQPTPVFLPGEFHGQRSLVGSSPWGHKESDIMEWLSLSLICKWFTCFLAFIHCWPAASRCRIYSGLVSVKVGTIGELETNL